MSHHYFSQDTIAALSTGPGGAIQIVRVSGPLAFSSLGRIIRSEKSSQAPARQATMATIYQENGEPIDQALYVRFVGPHSFSGEDVVEYHVHGGHFIFQRLLETLRQQGIRQALPGEFSFRAVRNGKMSVFQAQAIADLIAASNDSAVAIALGKLSGHQNQMLEKLAQDLRQLAVLGEIGIDFSDQDVDEVSLPRLKERLQGILDLLHRIFESRSRGLRAQEGIKVALIGVPNAGKSSFFNALLGEDRSIVSEHAGTTRDVIRETLTLRTATASITLRLEDTAGLRTSDNPVESIGIQRTHQATLRADLILFIHDATALTQPSQDQWQQLQQTPSLSSRTIGIFTKCDSISADQQPELIQFGHSLGIENWAFTSSLTGEGIQQAVELIVRTCEKWITYHPGELILTRLDHISAVEAAINHLNRAKQSADIDLFSSDIRQSLHSLAPLIGQTLPDDILQKIFSDFCIGK